MNWGQGVLAVASSLILSITTAGANAADNVLGLPRDAFANNGSLVIVGGGRVPEAVYDEFVRLAGGKQARIVIIPSAYAY